MYFSGCIPHLHINCKSEWSHFIYIYIFTRWPTVFAIISDLQDNKNRRTTFLTLELWWMELIGKNFSAESQRTWIKYWIDITKQATIRGSRVNRLFIIAYTFSSYYAKVDENHLLWKRLLMIETSSGFHKPGSTTYRLLSVPVRYWTVRYFAKYCFMKTYNIINYT